MQLVAPEAIASFNMDGVDYARDDKGLFKIDHPDHIRQAQMHGAVPYVPETDELDAAKARANDHSPLTAMTPDEKDREIADLKERLARLEAGGGGERPSATDGPREVVQGPGDTSLAPGGGGVIPQGSHTTSAVPQGQAGDQLDKDGNKLAKALENDPKFDEMDRDQLVGWLHSVGVATSGNVSKAKAREIVEETVKDYHDGLAAAAKERQDNMNTSTTHDTMPTT